MTGVELLEPAGAGFSVCRSVRLLLDPPMMLSTLPLEKIKGGRNLCYGFWVVGRNSIRRIFNAKAQRRKDAKKCHKTNASPSLPLRLCAIAPLR
jgi:hypothetical protein